MPMVSTLRLSFAISSFASSFSENRSYRFMILMPSLRTLKASLKVSTWLLRAACMSNPLPSPPIASTCSISPPLPRTVRIRSCTVSKQEYLPRVAAALTKRGARWISRSRNSFTRARIPIFSLGVQRRCRREGVQSTNYRIKLAFAVDLIWDWARWRLVLVATDCQPQRCLKDYEVEHQRPPSAWADPLEPITSCRPSFALASPPNQSRELHENFSTPRPAMCCRSCCYPSQQGKQYCWRVACVVFMLFLGVVHLDVQRILFVPNGGAPDIHAEWRAAVCVGKKRLEHCVA